MRGIAPVKQPVAVQASSPNEFRVRETLDEVDGRLLSRRVDRRDGGQIQSVQVIESGHSQQSNQLIPNCIHSLALDERDGRTARGD